jgi:hypothetical protein
MATASFRVLEAIKIHLPQYGEIVGVVFDMAPPEETEASGGVLPGRVTAPLFVVGLERQGVVLPSSPTDGFSAGGGGARVSRGKSTAAYRCGMYVSPR